MRTIFPPRIIFKNNLPPFEYLISVQPVNFEFDVIENLQYLDFLKFNFEFFEI